MAAGAENPTSDKASVTSKGLDMRMMASDRKGAASRPNGSHTE
jgi:hypothetical protein